MPTTQQRKRNAFPVFVAVVGGSGAGKTWLANQLLEAFGKESSIVSLDSFYKTREHLSMAQCERVNFDHPRAIDWDALKLSLANLTRGRKSFIPKYDFTRHRVQGKSVLSPKRILILEGLWVLRPVWLRKLFSFRIFVDCPNSVRRSRRMKRDGSERGRTSASIQQQFDHSVTPMHQRYVEPQKRWADIVIQSPLRKRDVHTIVTRIKNQTDSSTYDRTRG
jgi:uridine kinase